MKQNQDILPAKYVVTQSNRLIEADYSKAKLPARSLKIARLIVAKLKPDDSEFRLIKLKNSTIKQYLGYKSSVPYNRFFDDLDDICKRLNKEPLRVRTDKGTYINAFFISSWELDHRDGHTVFEISGRMKPYLLQLKDNYTTYQLGNIPRLGSSYSIRMYELLSQYRKLGKRHFELEDLKRMLGCTYDLYGHFKQKALKKAQRDLLEETDLRFEYEESKRGRKVIGLTFYIYPNYQEEEGDQPVLPFLEEPFTEEEETFPEPLLRAIIGLGISAANLEAMLNQGFEIIDEPKSRELAQRRCKSLEVYYLEKLTLLDQSKSNSNPAGFFIKALREDWKSPDTFKKTKAEEKGSTSSSDRKRLRQLEKLEEKLRQAYDKQHGEIASQLIDEEEGEFFRIYESVEERPGAIVRYRKEGLSPRQNYDGNIFLRVQINKHLRKAFPDRFTPLAKIEEERKAVNQEIEALQRYGIR